MRGAGCKSGIKIEMPLWRDGWEVFDFILDLARDPG
jgi:hypothetical protein